MSQLRSAVNGIFCQQLLWSVVASERPVIDAEPFSVLFCVLFSLVLCLSFSPLHFFPGRRTADYLACNYPGVRVGMCLFVLNFSCHRAMYIITHIDLFLTPPQLCFAQQGPHMVGHTHASHYSWRLYCCYKRPFHVCGNELYEIHYIYFPSFLSVSSIEQ